MIFKILKSGSSSFSSSLLDNPLKGWFIDGFRQFGLDQNGAATASLVVSIIVIISMVVAAIAAGFYIFGIVANRYNWESNAAQKLAHNKRMFLISLITAILLPILISTILGIAGIVFNQSAG